MNVLIITNEVTEERTILVKAESLMKLVKKECKGNKTVTFKIEMIEIE